MKHSAVQIAGLKLPAGNRVSPGSPKSKACAVPRRASRTSVQERRSWNRLRSAKKWRRPGCTYVLVAAPSSSESFSPSLSCSLLSLPLFRTRLDLTRLEQTVSPYTASPSPLYIYCMSHNSMEFCLLVVRLACLLLFGFTGVRCLVFVCTPARLPNKATQEQWQTLLSTPGVGGGGGGLLISGWVGRWFEFGATMRDL